MSADAAVAALVACAAVPLGGFSPATINRLYASAGYWRPDADYDLDSSSTVFWPCPVPGFCLEENSSITPQLGYQCREGHKGHLCAVCEDGWALQGAFCKRCNVGGDIQHWRDGTVGGTLFAVIFALCFSTCWLCMPLMPQAENSIKRARRRLEAHLTGQAPRAATVRISTTRLDQLTPGSTTRASDQQPGKKRGRLLRIKELILSPARVLLSFWQIISSFSGSLYVPWPAVYYHVSSAVNVTRLNFISILSIACASPQLSFFQYFNLVTLSTFAFIAYMLLLLRLGVASAKRHSASHASKHARHYHKADEERFKTRLLGVLTWGIFLIYPLVSQVTLQAFSCTRLERGTAWLNADYNIQCWVGKHWVYAGVAAMWTVFSPLGIPCGLLYLLTVRMRVRELASWHLDNAWLRSIVEKATVLGLPLPPNVVLSQIDRDTIPVDYLRALHSLLITKPAATEFADALQDIAAGKRRSIRLVKEDIVLVPAANGMLEAHSVSTSPRRWRTHTQDAVPEAPDCVPDSHQPVDLPTTTPSLLPTASTFAWYSDPHSPPPEPPVATYRVGRLTVKSALSALEAMTHDMSAFFARFCTWWRDAVTTDSNKRSLYNAVVCAQRARLSTERTHALGTLLGRGHRL